MLNQSNKFSMLLIFTFMLVASNFFCFGVSIFNFYMLYSIISGRMPFGDLFRWFRVLQIISIRRDMKK